MRLDISLARLAVYRAIFSLVSCVALAGLAEIGIDPLHLNAYFT